jgi:two-component system response regulator FlrC
LQMMTAPAEALPVASAAVPEAPAQFPEPTEEAVQSAINLQHAVKSSEQQIIMAALQSTESREEAARKLGISPRTLRYKLAQLRSRGMSLSFAE